MPTEKNIFSNNYYGFNSKSHPSYFHGFVIKCITQLFSFIKNSKLNVFIDLEQQDKCLSEKKSLKIESNAMTTNNSLFHYSSIKSVESNVGVHARLARVTARWAGSIYFLRRILFLLFSFSIELGYNQGVVERCIQVTCSLFPYLVNFLDDSLPSLHLAKAGLVKELLWLKNNDLVDYDENSKQLHQEVRTVLNLKWKTPYPQSNYSNNASTPRSARNKSTGLFPFTNNELVSMKVCVHLLRPTFSVTNLPSNRTVINLIPSS